MRIVAFAGLALALALAAVLLVTGGPQLALAQAPSQRVDDVQIEMVLDNHPETLFPAEVVSGTTVVVPGTRSVSGVVRFNQRDDAGTPLGTRSTKVSVIDPVGLEVYSTTFQAQTPASGYGSQTFSVTGDQMLDTYRKLSASGTQRVLNLANSIPQVSSGPILTPTLILVGNVGQLAGDTARAVDRLLTFTEVPTPTRASLTLAHAELISVTNVADAVVTAGANQAPNEFNNGRALIQQAAQAAKNAYDAAAPSLQGLTDVKIPITNACDFDPQGRPVKRVYSSVVSQIDPGNTQAGFQRRDDWEWQVGTPTNILYAGTISVIPPQIFTTDVLVSNIHTATVRAALLDVQCLPLRDSVPVTLRTTIGSFDPMTNTVQVATQTDAATGEHGIAQATLRAGTTPGTGRVSVQGLSGVETNVTVVGPATQITFLSASGQTGTRYISAGDQEAKFQVQVRDAAGNVVANGTQVRFTVTNGLGTFAQEVVTTQNGLAEATFRAGSTPGNAVVTATVVGSSSVQATQNIAVVGPPAAVSLAVDTQNSYSTTIYIGGAELPTANNTVVVATVTDANNNPVADGTVVELRLSASGRAVWEDPLPGSTTATRVITSGGKARARLTVAPDNRTPGSVDVRAFVGSLPPSQPLTITIAEAPVGRTYTVYLPVVLKKAICGRNAGEAGCYSPAKTGQ